MTVGFLMKSLQSGYNFKYLSEDLLKLLNKAEITDNTDNTER